jgi:hypothetical protein
MTDLTVLHNACRAALAAYITEAQRTCELLTDIAIFPVPADKRYALIEQRLRENEAYERYHFERTKLFDLASGNGNSHQT